MLRALLESVTRSVVSPRAMREPPALDHALRTAPPSRHHALLINPFYPKDPHASFGKHVLTPTLALTSASPPRRRRSGRCATGTRTCSRGRRPSSRSPQVVGITVHLTFAERAYELARWYRSRGAKVVLGGLHVLSCPDEARPHADALAVGEGVQLWPAILARRRRRRAPRRATRAATAARTATSRRRAASSSTRRASSRPRASSRRAAATIAAASVTSRPTACACPTRSRDLEQVVAQFAARRASPTPSSSTTTSARKPAYLRALCRGLAPVEKIWSAAVSIDVTDDPSLVREMALAGCTGVFVGFESLTDENLDDARKKSPRPADYARRVALFHDNGIQVNGSFVLGFDHDRPRRLRAHRRLGRGEPPRVRDVPHPHALPRDAALPADGGRGPAAPQAIGPSTTRPTSSSARAT